MTVAIYIRWSTEEQTEGTTLDVQRDACQHFALSQGWAVPDTAIYIDDGYSGGTLDRPAITRLREAVRRRQVDVVVVYTIDRLSRNIVDAVQLVLKEWDDRCHLACVRQPVDTRTEMGRMFFSILAMFADFERAQIRSRTMAGRLRRASEGDWIGQPPYGYTREDKRLVIKESEAIVVRNIFGWYTSGMGVRAVVKQLASDGIPSRDGAVWGKSSVARLLENPTYAGRHTFGRRRRGREDEPIQVRRDPLVDISGAVPAIVDEDTWARAQTLRTERIPLAKSGGRSIGGPHLLTGIARCRCGSPVMSKIDSRGSRYYVCTRRVDRGDCECGWIPQDGANEAVVSQLRTLLSGRVADQLETFLSLEDSRQAGDIRTLYADAEASLRRLEHEADRLDRDYRSGQLPAKRYDRLLADVERDQRDASTRLQALAGEIEALTTRESDRALLESDLAQLHSWETMDVSQRKQLLRSLITSLTLYRDPSTRAVSVDVAVRGVSLGGLLH